MAVSKTEVDTQTMIETITISVEEHEKLIKERDEYKNAYETNVRNAQAIIEEKNIIISTLAEKIKNMAKK